MRAPLLCVIYVDAKHKIVIVTLMIIGRGLDASDVCDFAYAIKVGTFPGTMTQYVKLPNRYAHALAVFAGKEKKFQLNILRSSWLRLTSSLKRFSNF